MAVVFVCPVLFCFVVFCLCDWFMLMYVDGCCAVVVVCGWSCLFVCLFVCSFVCSLLLLFVLVVLAVVDAGCCFLLLLSVVVPYFLGVGSRVLLML